MWQAHSALLNMRQGVPQDLPDFTISDSEVDAAIEQPPAPPPQPRFVYHTPLQEELIKIWKYHKQNHERLMAKLLEVSREDWGERTTPSYNPQGRDEFELRREMLFVLCETTDSYIFDALGAHIPDRHINDRRSVLPNRVFSRKTQLSDADRLEPAIYANFLCTDDGQSISIDELKLIIQEVRAYHAHLVWDAGAEKWYRPQQSQAEATQFQEYDNTSFERRVGATKQWVGTGLLDNSTRRFCTKHKRVEQARLKMDQWERLLQDIMDRFRQRCGLQLSGHARFPWSWFGEVGWTQDVAFRASQHENGTSSVDLMNLIDAICQVKFRTARVRVRTFLVARPRQPELAPMSEHVHSMLNFAYTNRGGFNTTVAGGSTESRYNIGVRTYERLQRDRDANIRCARNISHIERQVEIMEQDFKTVETYRKDVQRVGRLQEALGRLSENTKKMEAVLKTELGKLEPLVKEATKECNVAVDELLQAEEDARKAQVLEEFWSKVQNLQTTHGMTLKQLQGVEE